MIDIDLYRVQTVIQSVCVAIMASSVHLSWVFLPAAVAAQALLLHLPFQRWPCAKGLSLATSLTLPKLALGPD